jgi:L-alanine-DL-glutamate epimerase-like enolase superfamily enzyme
MRASIARFELSAVDLPFRLKFKHSAAERQRSESLFLRCVTDGGASGYGESLPRVYVTGESRDDAFELLAENVLPKLVGRSFGDMADVEAFLGECDGRAPAAWVDASTPQGAAWCAVDLALLDVMGRAFGERPLADATQTLPAAFRYSGVLSAETGWKKTLMLLAYRAMGVRHLKLKVGPETTVHDIRQIRALVGRRMDLRADANMGWTADRALEQMRAFSAYGVRSYEQAIPAEDLEGQVRLVAESGLDVMADESLHTRESLELLIEHKAATAINARISKCGGLVATRNRCREALAAGLWIQVGCQVGESSLLSSAHLRLCAALGEVRYAEGCFGRLLLAEDPASPVLQFRRGGRAPDLPQGPGLGVTIDEETLGRYTTRRQVVDA